jgi:type I restriction enzyme, R subunit
VASLTGQPPIAGGLDAAAHEAPSGFATSDLYVQGDPKNYDRNHAVDVAELLAFLQATQPQVVESLELDQDGPQRQKFLHRLQGKIAGQGVIEVLRKGIKHGPVSVDLFYGSPTPGNAKAEELFRANIFSVTRQLRYSQDQTRLALDLCLFINGLPIATFELKNRLTKQTVADAIQQYRRDRDPREILFRPGCCAVHFAVDDHEVRMCTELKGKESWFLPFNKGWNEGAGNPPNPDGIETDYLWKQVFARHFQEPAGPVTIRAAFKPRRIT